MGKSEVVGFSCAARARRNRTPQPPHLAAAFAVARGEARRSLWQEFWDLKENILVCERILLQTLEELDLSQNCLTEISPAIRKLVKIRMLDLSGNGLRELPAEMGELESVLLERLLMKKNKPPRQRITPKLRVKSRHREVYFSDIGKFS